MELCSLTLEGMLASAAIEYLGIATVPVLVLILVLLYTGREKWVTARNTAPLFVIPAVTIIMVATNQLHYLYYSTTGVDTSGPFPMLVLTRGPWFLVHTVYSYILLIAGTALLITRLGKHNTIFRNQVVSMLAGVSVPWAVSILYVGFGLMLFGHVDPTPFAFTVTGMLIAWSMFRHGLFDILPVAYDKIADSMDDAIIVMDRKNRIVVYNRSAHRILGLSSANIGKPASVAWKDHPDLMNLAGPGEAARFVTELRQDNSKHHYEVSAYNLTDRHGMVIGKVISLHDTTDRRRAEDDLRASEEKFRLLIENSHDIIYILSPDGTFTFVSPSWTTLLGHPTDQVVGQPFPIFVHPDDLPECLSFMQLVMESGKRQEGIEYRVLHANGNWFWHTSSAVPLRDRSGAIVGFEGIARDITERKQMLQKLEAMATHDYLTGLPNRLLLLDRFTIAAALAQRNKARLAVMSLDLDKFKPINDSLGHDAGDQVLKTVSARLSGIIRASDTLARIGGDEFILVMLETDHAGDASTIAQKILDSFREPVSIVGHQLHLSTSIGLAIYPQDAGDLETLMKKSDAALYYSKGHGRNQFKFFGDGDVIIHGDHKSTG